jgi:hypothetical protein
VRTRDMTVALLQMWVGRQRMRGRELQMLWPAHGQKFSATLLTKLVQSVTVHWQLSVTRFPLAWSVEELDAGFVIKDRDGPKAGVVYFEDELGG